MAIGRIPEPGTGIPESIVDAKGDLVTATAADTPARLAVGTNEYRLVADSGETTGLKYVADTTNYAIAAKGDLLVGTAADTLQALSVGTNGYTLVADSTETTGLKWAAAGGVDYDYQLLNAGGTALTGASTVTVSGISNKNFIHIIVDAASSASASSTIALRLNTDTGTNYSYVAVFTGSATGGTGNTGGDYIPLADMGNSAGNSVTSIISIAGCNASGVKPLTFTGYATGSSSQIHRSGGATYKGTSTISSISIVSLSGNLDGGTVYVYGA